MLEVDDYLLGNTQNTFEQTAVDQEDENSFIAKCSISEDNRRAELLGIVIRRRDNRHGFELPVTSMILIRLCDLRMKRNGITLHVEQEEPDITASCQEIPKECLGGGIIIEMSRLSAPGDIIIGCNVTLMKDSPVNYDIILKNTTIETHGTVYIKTTSGNILLDNVSIACKKLIIESTLNGNIIIDSSSLSCFSLGKEKKNRKRESGGNVHLLCGGGILHIIGQSKIYSDDNIIIQNVPYTVNKKGNNNSIEFVQFNHNYFPKKCEVIIKDNETTLEANNMISIFGFSLKKFDNSIITSRKQYIEMAQSIVIEGSEGKWESSKQCILSTPYLVCNSPLFSKGDIHINVNRCNNYSTIECKFIYLEQVKYFCNNKSGKIKATSITGWKDSSGPKECKFSNRGELQLTRLHISTNEACERYLVELVNEGSMAIKEKVIISSNHPYHDVEIVNRGSMKLNGFICESKSSIVFNNEGSIICESSNELHVKKFLSNGSMNIEGSLEIVSPNVIIKSLNCNKYLKILCDNLEFLDGSSGLYIKESVYISVLYDSLLKTSLTTDANFTIIHSGTGFMNFIDWKNSKVKVKGKFDIICCNSCAFLNNVQLEQNGEKESENTVLALHSNISGSIKTEGNLTIDILKRAGFNASIKSNDLTIKSQYLEGNLDIHSQGNLFINTVNLLADIKATTKGSATYQVSTSSDDSRIRTRSEEHINFHSNESFKSEILSLYTNKECHLLLNAGASSRKTEINLKGQKVLIVSKGNLDSSIFVNSLRESNIVCEGNVNNVLDVKAQESTSVLLGISSDGVYKTSTSLSSILHVLNDQEGVISCIADGISSVVIEGKDSGATNVEGNVSTYKAKKKEKGTASVHGKQKSKIYVDKTKLKSTINLTSHSKSSFKSRKHSGHLKQEGRKTKTNIGTATYESKIESNSTEESILKLVNSFGNKIINGKDVMIFILGEDSSETLSNSKNLHYSANKVSGKDKKYKAEEDIKFNIQELHSNITMDAREITGSIDNFISGNISTKAENDIFLSVKNDTNNNLKNIFTSAYNTQLCVDNDLFANVESRNINNFILNIGNTIHNTVSSESNNTIMNAVNTTGNCSIKVKGDNAIIKFKNHSGFISVDLQNDFSFVADIVDGNIESSTKGNAQFTLGSTTSKSQIKNMKSNRMNIVIKKDHHGALYLIDISNGAIYMENQCGNIKANVKGDLILQSKSNQGIIQSNKLLISNASFDNKGIILGDNLFFKVNKFKNNGRIESNDFLTLNSEDFELFSNSIIKSNRISIQTIQGKMDGILKVKSIDIKSTKDLEIVKNAIVETSDITIDACNNLLMNGKLTATNTIILKSCFIFLKHCFLKSHNIFITAKDKLIQDGHLIADNQIMINSKQTLFKENSQTKGQNIFLSADELVEIEGLIKGKSIDIKSKGNLELIKKGIIQATCLGINVLNKFIGNGSLIVEEQGIIEGYSLYFNRLFQLNAKVINIIAKNNILQEGNIVGKRIDLRAKDIILSNTSTINCEETFLTADNFQTFINSTLQANNIKIQTVYAKLNGIMKGNTININSTSDLEIAKNSSIQAIYLTLNAYNNIIIEGQVTAKDQIVLTSNFLYLKHCLLQSRNIFITAKDELIQDGHLIADNQLMVNSKQILFKENSQTKGQNIFLSADELVEVEGIIKGDAINIKSKGDIELLKKCTIHTRYLEITLFNKLNAGGTLSVDERCFIEGYSIYFSNLFQLNSKIVDINASGMLFQKGKITSDSTFLEANNVYLSHTSVLDSKKEVCIIAKNSFNDSYRSKILSNIVSITKENSRTDVNSYIESNYFKLKTKDQDLKGLNRINCKEIDIEILGDKKIDEDLVLNCVDLLKLTVNNLYNSANINAKSVSIQTKGNFINKGSVNGENVLIDSQNIFDNCEGKVHGSQNEVVMAKTIKLVSNNYNYSIQRKYENRHNIYYRAKEGSLDFKNTLFNASGNVTLIADNGKLDLGYTKTYVGSKPFFHTSSIHANEINLYGKEQIDMQGITIHSTNGGNINSDGDINMQSLIESYVSKRWSKTKYFLFIPVGTDEGYEESVVTKETKIISETKPIHVNSEDQINMNGTQYCYLNKNNLSVGDPDYYATIRGKKGVIQNTVSATTKNYSKDTLLWWGTEESSSHDHGLSTLVTSTKGCRVISPEGKIEGTSPSYYCKSLEFIARDGVQFKAWERNYSYKKEDWGVSVNVFTPPSLYNNMSNVLSRMDSMCNMNDGPTGFISDLVSTGISSVNIVKNLSQLALNPKSYSLNQLKNSFSNIGIGFYNNIIESKGKDEVLGNIFAENLLIKVLDDKAESTLQTNLKAQKLYLDAANLIFKGSVHEKRSTMQNDYFGISINPFSGGLNPNFNFSHSKQNSRNEINQLGIGQVEEVINLNPKLMLTLDGYKMDINTIKGKDFRVNMKHRQDTHHSEANSCNLSLGLNIVDDALQAFSIGGGANVQNSESATTVKSSFNYKHCEAKVDITEEFKGNDYSNHTGFGFSVAPIHFDLSSPNQQTSPNIEKRDSSDITIPLKIHGQFGDTKLRIEVPELTKLKTKFDTAMQIMENATNFKENDLPTNRFSFETKKDAEEANDSYLFFLQSGFTKEEATDIVFINSIKNNTLTDITDETLLRDILKPFVTTTINNQHENEVLESSKQNVKDEEDKEKQTPKIKEKETITGYKKDTENELSQIPPKQIQEQDEDQKTKQTATTNDEVNGFLKKLKEDSLALVSYPLVDQLSQIGEKQLSKAMKIASTNISKMLKPLLLSSQISLSAELLDNNDFASSKLMNPNSKVVIESQIKTKPLFDLKASKYVIEKPTVNNIELIDYVESSSNIKAVPSLPLRLFKPLAPHILGAKLFLQAESIGINEYKLLNPKPLYGIELQNTTKASTSFVDKNNVFKLYEKSIVDSKSTTNTSNSNNRELKELTKSIATSVATSVSSGYNNAARERHWLENSLRTTTSITNPYSTMFVELSETGYHITDSLLTGKEINWDGIQELKNAVEPNKIVGGMIGGYIGAAIGGYVGTVVAGPYGTAVGMKCGQVIGGVVGGNIGHLCHLLYLEEEKHLLALESRVVEMKRSGVALPDLKNEIKYDTLGESIIY
ncbi:hypothetical protein ABK040_014664 [Willaertia magna]